MIETQNSINVFLIYHFICVLNDSFVLYVVFELLAISGGGGTSPPTQAVRGPKSLVLLGLNIIQTIFCQYTLFRSPDFDRKFLPLSRMTFIRAGFLDHPLIIPV